MESTGSALHDMMIRFISRDTWHDLGEHMSATECELVIEAARELGYESWADEYENLARTEYDPEGYTDLDADAAGQ